MRIRAYSLAYALLLSGSSVATLSTSTPAAAQTADAMTEMARQRFQEGVTFYDAKDYEKARAAFLQAYALKKHPSVLLNLAQSELRSGHEADAAQHFDQYLRENPAATPAERGEAEKGLAAARARVAEVTVSAPAGAQIFVDGEPVGAAPLPGPVFLPPGNHKLEARKDGATGASDVVAAAGAKSTAALSFGETPAAGPVATPGTGEPGAPGPTPPGDGGGLSVDTKDPREPFLDWYFRGPVSWIGTGAFGVGLIGGIAFAASSSASYSSADDVKAKILAEGDKRGTSAPCSPTSGDFAHFRDACATYQDNVDAGDSKKTVATVGFVLAGLGAATVVGGYFLTAKKVPAEGAPQAKRPKSTTVASPVLTDNFKGFALSGSF